MATTTAALRLPEDLAARYDKLAKDTGRTKTYYMTQALADSIEKLEYEYGLLKQVEDYRAKKLETYTLDEVKAHCGLDDLKPNKESQDSIRDAEAIIAKGKKGYKNADEMFDAF